MHTLRRTCIAGAAAALGTFGWLAATAPTISAGIVGVVDPSPAELIVPGTYEWTVPTGVVCANFDVYGADGGSGGDRLVDVDVDAAAGPDEGGAGGKGGRVTADVTVTPGEVITLTVGGYGQGGESAMPMSGPSVGGDNGGGNGGVPGLNGTGGGGGGGASDVRQGGTGLEQRIIVAGGGGGGAGGGASGGGGDGGAGGNPGGAGADPLASSEVGAQAPVEGQAGGGGGGGGTDSAGGAAGQQPEPATADPTAGTFGVGGAGGQATNGGGGGGGGWFGGGGGAAGIGTDPGAGGGGGSSHGPASATFETGVGATNDNNGLIIVRWTPGDTACQAIAPAAVVTDPTFTG